MLGVGEMRAGVKVVAGITRKQWKRKNSQNKILEQLRKKCGEGNGTPLQYSCLENPRDGGAWWAAIYGVAQSRTRLKRLSSRKKWVEVPVQNIKHKRNLVQIEQKKTHCTIYSYSQQYYKFCHVKNSSNYWKQISKKAAQKEAREQPPEINSEFWTHFPR